LQDLIDHTKADPHEDYPNHNVESFEMAASIDPDSQEFKDLEATRNFIRGEGGIRHAMDRNQLDLLVTPSWSNVVGSFACHEGTPVIATPLGFYSPDKAIKKERGCDLVTIGPGIP